MSSSTPPPLPTPPQPSYGQQGNAPQPMQPQQQQPYYPQQSYGQQSGQPYQGQIPGAQPPSGNNKGCMIAALVAGGVALIGIILMVVAFFWVANKANDVVGELNNPTSSASTSASSSAGSSGNSSTKPTKPAPTPADPSDAPGQPSDGSTPMMPAKVKDMEATGKSEVMAVYRNADGTKVILASHTPLEVSYSVEQFIDPIKIGQWTCGTTPEVDPDTKFCAAAAYGGTAMIGGLDDMNELAAWGDEFLAKWK